MRFIVFLLSLCSLGLATDSTRISAFKQQFRLSNAFSIVRPSDVTYQLWEGFSLVRKANSGDPEALHELGIRYLVGQGFNPDSAKAFELIQRAAENGHLLAYFNAGVFLHNGWGVSWDPFRAYKYFQASARKGVREGAFAYALYFTDNLTVNKDLDQASHWMRISAENGYPPAKEVLPEIERFRLQDRQDSVLMMTTPQTASGNTFEPLPITFTEEAEEKIENDFILADVLRSLSDQWKKRVETVSVLNDSLLFRLLLYHAEWGVPEEFTILGRCYENGIGVDRDSSKALAAYIRAVRLESRRAPALLIRLLNNETLLMQVRQKAMKGDAESQYIIACFALTEIYPSQKKEDILLFLQRSSQQNYIPAITEYGSAYFSGQIVKQSQPKGIEYWTRAALLGSHESFVRLASARLLTGTGIMSIDSAVGILAQGVKEGSMIAQMSLAFYYEQGTGGKANYAEAVKLYRTAMQRGSRSAYASLQRMYDSIRPSDKEFQIFKKEE